MKYNMTFDKPTLVAITAPTCSGKSFLLDLMTKARPFSKQPFEPLFERIVGTTTRLSRQGEEEGVDYYFLTREQSATMEANGEFAELIEFRGIRYGVTKKEMLSKMKGKLAPIMILEPQGLLEYEKMCRANDWEIFKIYVYTTEALRIERLTARTSIDVRNAVMEVAHRDSPHTIITQVDALIAAEKLIKTHTDRLLSITGDERRWQSVTHWDALIPGNDPANAIRDIEQGIKWRNSQNARLNT